MKIRIVYFVSICLLATSKATNGAIGITWGRMSVQRLLPSIVVDLLLQNGIKHCRIYGSGIDLTLTYFNIFGITNDEQADAYVQSKILPFYGPVSIRRVYVANYVLEYSRKNQTVNDAAIRLMILLQSSLDRAGVGDRIKSTMTHSYHTLKQNTTCAFVAFDSVD